MTANRSTAVPSATAEPAAGKRRSDWRAVAMVVPHLWEYRGRVLLALSFLVIAKVANVGVPVLLKRIVDSLDAQMAPLVVPLALLVAYGLLRLSTTLFTELREFLFAKVTQLSARLNLVRVT